MRFDIVSSIQAWQDDASSWVSNPIINHGGTNVSLSEAVGNKATTPTGLPNPPQCYPTKSKYQFDPLQFSGPNAYPALRDMLKNACTGCTLYEQRKDTTKHIYQLRCNRYPTDHKSSVKFSDPQCFTKDNVVPMTNKRSTTHSQAAFSRMQNPKLRSKPRTKKASDRRDHETKQTQKNKRIFCNRAAEHDSRCKMNIKIFMNKWDDSWHLNTGSDFQHSYHLPDDSAASVLNKSDLTEDNINALNILFENGVNPSVIAQVMTDLVHMQSDKRGSFLASTIYNIANSEQETMDKIAGVTSNWSSAEKLLKTLESYVSCILYANIFTTFNTT